MFIGPFWVIWQKFRPRDNSEFVSALHSSTIVAFRAESVSIFLTLRQAIMQQSIKASETMCNLRKLFAPLSKKRSFNTIISSHVTGESFWPALVTLKL